VIFELIEERKETVEFSVKRGFQIDNGASLFEVIAAVTLAAENAGEHGSIDSLEGPCFA